MVQLEGNQSQITLSRGSRGSGDKGVDAGVAPVHHSAGTREEEVEVELELDHQVQYHHQPQHTQPKQYHTTITSDHSRGVCPRGRRRHGKEPEVETLAEQRHKVAASKTGAGRSRAWQQRRIAGRRPERLGCAGARTSAAECGGGVESVGRRAPERHQPAAALEPVGDGRNRAWRRRIARARRGSRGREVRVCRVEPAPLTLLL